MKNLLSLYSFLQQKWIERVFAKFCTCCPRNSYFHNKMFNPFDHDQHTGKVVELSFDKFKDLSLNSKEQASFLRYLRKYQAKSDSPDDFSRSLSSIISIINPYNESFSSFLSFDQNMQSQPQQTVSLKEIPKTRRQLMRQELKMEYKRLGAAMLKNKRQEYQASINNILLKHKLEELTKQKQLPLPRQQLDPLLNSHRNVYEQQLKHKLAKYQSHQKMLNILRQRQTHYRQ